MKLSRLIKWMMFATVLGVVYINMQMQIIELAYRGKAKEKLVRKLIEYNSHLTSSILSLKSSNNLGEKLLADNNEMQFLAPQNIVQVRGKKVLNVKPAPEKSKNAGDLLSFLFPGEEAHARGEK
jgi:hypothetical protein